MYIILTLGGGGFPSAEERHCADDRRSTWSVSSTHSEARANHSAGQRTHSLGLRCASDSFVRFIIFSAMAPFVTRAQISDSLPYKCTQTIQYYFAMKFY